MKSWCVKWKQGLSLRCCEWSPTERSGGVLTCRYGRRGKGPGEGWSYGSKRGRGEGRVKESDSMDYPAPGLAYCPPGIHINIYIYTIYTLFTSRWYCGGELIPGYEEWECVLPVGIWTAVSVCPVSCWSLTFPYSARRWLQGLLGDYLHPHGYWRAINWARGWVTYTACTLFWRKLHFSQGRGSACFKLSDIYFRG